MGNTDVAKIYDFIEHAAGNVETLENEMLNYEQLNLPVQHLFVNGMYARQLLIPADTILTGRVHKYGYVDVMIYGDISVYIPGQGHKHMQGYNLMEGVPGRKRAGYTHKDTLWLTVHKTDAVICQNIEEELTFYDVKSYSLWAEAQLLEESKKCLS